MKKSSDFIYVKCADKKTATTVAAKSPPEIIFFDPDGEEIVRMGIRGAADIEKAMEEALKKYSNKEISWNVYDDKAIDSAKESKKLVVIAFTAGDSKDCDATLKALEDRTLVKLQDKCVFVKIEFRKDSDDARKWGATSAPTVVLVDPNKEAGSRAVIERALGKKSAKELKSLLLKALKTLEKNG